MNWQLWLKGLVSAVAGGAVNSVGVVVADPTSLQDGTAVKKMGTMAAFGAVLGLLTYLKQSPLPAKN